MPDGREVYCVCNFYSSSYDLGTTEIDIQMVFEEQEEARSYFEDNKDVWTGLEIEGPVRVLGELKDESKVYIPCIWSSKGWVQAVCGTLDRAERYARKHNYKGNIMIKSAKFIGRDD